AAWATARGESPHRIPLSMSHCALDFVRLWPVTECPCAMSRSAIRPPIAPRPTYPRFAIWFVDPIAGERRASDPVVYFRKAGKLGSGSQVLEPSNLENLGT